MVSPQLAEGQGVGTGLAVAAQGLGVVSAKLAVVPSIRRLSTDIKLVIKFLSNLV